MIIKHKFAERDYMNKVQIKAAKRIISELKNNKKYYCWESIEVFPAEHDKLTFIFHGKKRSVIQGTGEDILQVGNRCKITVGLKESINIKKILNGKD